MKRGIAIAICAGFLAAGAAWANPQHTEMPKPGSEVQKLDWFVGDWKSEGEMKEGPWGPGGKFTGEDKCEWFAGKWQIVCKMKGKGPMGEMQGLGISGYDTEGKAYTWYGIDSMGMADSARGNVSGQTWTYQSKSSMMGKTIHGRYTMNVTGPDSYTWKYETSEDGKTWSVGGEGKSSRVKKLM